MATQETLNQVQQLYVAYYGRPADAEGLAFWAEALEANGGDTSVIINDFGNSAEFEARFGEMTNEELVNNLYQQLFGRDAEAEGLAFYVGHLEEGNLSLAEIAAEIAGGAQDGEGNADATALANKIAAANLYTDATAGQHSGTDADNYAAEWLAGINADTDVEAIDMDEVVANLPEPTVPEEPTDPSVPGETFTLTAGTDRLEGTENDDTFEAYLSQNEMAGGVSNTLSSADHLDGGAGYDSLFAELAPEFLGSAGFAQLHTQPRTTSIEQVEFESRELGMLGIEGDVTNVVDAKHMYGVERIGSKQSDASLQIDNLTTLANDGVTKRNTSDLTITMDHTANTNSTGAASDLTVYFDDNYLISGEQSEHSIQLRIVNNFQLAENEAPLSGFQSVTFSVGDQEVVVDITDAETYQQVADAINAELAEQGISGVEASTATARTSLFSDDVPAGAGYEQGDLAGEYLPVNIVSTTEPLENGPIELESNIANFDGLNTWVAGDSTTTDDPISVNIELTKVGRGGIGGDLLVGAKSMAQGIEVFNVTVMGEDHLPNNLGTLASTGNDLHTVNIASEAGLDSYASLEIRDGLFQQFIDGSPDGSLELVDASAFRGDLLLGTNQRIINLDELIATGGGDVTYYAVNTSGRDSDNSETEVTTGAGNDLIDVLLIGRSNSNSTASSTVINAGDGDNIVSVDTLTPGAGNEADVTTGSGNDVVYGGNVSLTANTGAGDDAIYAENTGDRAVVTLFADEWQAAAGAGVGGVEQSELLYGREVQVTLAIPGMGGDADGFDTGFENTVSIEASNGYLTTERDLYEAVARAINEDPVLSKLATASVDSNGHLTVQYLVDGLAGVSSDLVQFEVLGDWDDLNNTQRNNVLSAVQAQNSSITDTDLETAYDDVVTNVGTITADGIAAEEHEFEVDVSALDPNVVFTFTIDGESADLNPAGDLSNLEGSTIDLGDETYTISVIADVLTLTSESTGAVEGGDPGLTVTDGTEIANGDFTNGVTGSDVGGDSLANGGTNIVNAGTGNDVIVLSTATDTTDTIVLQGNFDTNTIVHFEDGAAGDVLNFTSYGVNGATVGSSDYGVTNDQVNVVEFDSGDFTGNVTFESLTAANVAQAIGDTVANGRIDSIILVQNGDNAGEYKAFDVNSANNSPDFTVDLIGVLDFGEAQTFDDANFA